MAIRYGIIGAGMMGQEHVRNLNLHKECKITAIADPDEGMRRSTLDLIQYPVEEFANHKDLLSAGVCDALIIATPNDTHHPILLDALDANRPILCEKPLCTTSEHCREVIAKSDSKSAPVWVAMEYRYMPPLQLFLSKLEAGAVGNVRMLAIREHRFPFLKKVGDWNRFSERTGDTLIEKCCHFWDLMRLILNCNPVRVYSSAGTDVNHLDESYEGRTPDILDNAFTILDFENGARAMLDLCMFAEGAQWQEEISATGEKARIDVRVPGPARFNPDGKERKSEMVYSERHTRNVKREEIEIDESVLSAGDHHGSTYFQHLHFLNLIKNGKGKPEVDLQDGFWSVLIGEAATQSAKTGEAVCISMP